MKANGQHTVSVKVTDVHGSSGVASQTVTVKNWLRTSREKCG